MCCLLLMTLKLRRTVQMDHILNKVRNFRDIPERAKIFITSLSVKSNLVSFYFKPSFIWC